MSQPAVDRNLLFGILAMQKGFITREQLANAMKAAVFEQEKPLGDILCAQKTLNRDNQALLDALVQDHLAKCDNNIDKSLTALGIGVEVRKDLLSITEVDAPAGVSQAPLSATDVDPFATVAPRPAGGTRTGREGPMPLPSGLTPAGGLRFRHVRPHAKGGLGEVFVAHDEELHREVALKEIQDRQADNPDSRTRFMLEAEITGGLEHPGIVPVYGLGVYPDGRPYYAMRFIRGDSLKEAVERFHKSAQSGMSAGERALEQRSLLNRFVDVCNAIGYAHSRDILHRDLKPANIMLGKYGETLVVDWGLAKPIGQSSPAREPSTSLEPGEGSLIPSSLSSAPQTFVGSAVGTPHYMSPEQAAGKLDQLGPTSDVYSLGATLYSILTGQAPVTDNNLGTVLQRVQRGEFPRPRAVKPEVHPALEAICLKAMAHKPADRYATTRMLADDIEHWLADEPVSAWPEPWTVKARRWIGRHATLVTSVGSAVVVAIFGLIVATALLTAANDRERKAKELAQEQRGKALANFQLALGAVRRYHTEVSEEELLKEPGMQPLRKRLLQAAEEYFRKFRDERKNDPAMQGELGRATFRLAQITDELGMRGDAINLHREAATLFETLPPEKASADFAADQAACYHHLGRLYRVTNQIADSDRYYAKALALWDELLARDPSAERLQAGRARTHMGIGNAQQNARNLNDATTSYKKSLTEWTALAKAHSHVIEYQRELAVNQNNLAMIFQALPGKEKDAEDALRGAHGVQKKLADAWPNYSKYQDDFARTCFNLASVLNDGASRQTFFQEAADRWQALVQQHPAVTGFHTRLAETHMAIARTLRDDDAKKAQTHAQVALEIQRKLTEKHKDDLALQGDLANGLYTFADACRVDPQTDRSKEAQAAYEEAVRIQVMLVREKSLTPSYQRDLARSYNGLGALHTQGNREEKATDAYKKAVASWEKLVKEYPAEQEYATGLARSCFQLGNLSKVAGDWKKADSWYTQAANSFDGGKLKTLDTPLIKSTLASVYWMRADARTHLQQHAAALTDWNRAYELARPAQRPAILLPRAAALARVGKHVEAIREIEPLVGKAKAGESLYRFACVYALSAGAAKEQKQQANEYAGEAIKLLLAARDVGYFKSLATQKKLFLDPDLHALRDRPEFQKLTSDYKLQ